MVRKRVTPQRQRPKAEPLGAWDRSTKEWPTKSGTYSSDSIDGLDSGYHAEQVLIAAAERREAAMGAGGTLTPRSPASLGSTARRSV